MAQRTQLFELRPWIGGMNTTLDSAMIPANQVVNAENVFQGVGPKRKREEIDKNWDSVTSASASIVGAADFWYLSSGSKIQIKASVDATGAFRKYDADDGDATSLTVEGTSVSTPTLASMKVFNSLLITAMDGTTNRVKKWDGSGNVKDLRNRWEIATTNRALASGTVTLTLASTFKGQTGDTIVVTGVTQTGGTYNGTWTVASVGGANNTVITYSNGTSQTEASTADTGGEVNGLAPKGSILQEHQGRLLMNDRDNLNRIHYSEVGDAEIWFGWGDSGAIDIVPGDDDPVGITAIFPTFQGDLYVAKRTKLYRVRGQIPYHSIDKVTDGLGAISHEAVAAVDQSDIVWLSEKGVHSLVTTAKYGDVEEAFLSKDIQKSVTGLGNYGWSQSRLRYVKARYLNTENTVFFAVTESKLSGTKNNCLWLFDTVNKQWLSRWPNVSCESVFVATDSDRKRLYTGSSTTRIYQTFAGGSSDTTETGASQAITLRIKTGKIYVDNDPYTTKAFKKLALYYTPRGIQTVAAQVTVDKFSAQSVSFDASGGGSLLGSTFTLGSSTLGGEGLFAPYTRTINGYGRGIEVEFLESNTSSSYNLEGFGIEFERMGVVHRVDQGGSSN